jgi:hypothetical protein
MKKDYARYLAGIITESQYYDLLEMANKIVVKDKVRTAVASIQTYWSKPGKALLKIQDILFQHGYILGGVPTFSVHDRSPEHRQTFLLEKLKNPMKPEEGSDPVQNDLVFSWHWISDEKVEVTAYIS